MKSCWNKRERGLSEHDCSFSLEMLDDSMWFLFFCVCFVLFAEGGCHVQAMVCGFRALEAMMCWGW